jgi:hypothetical protein
MMVVMLLEIMPCTPGFELRKVFFRRLHFLVENRVFVFPKAINFFSSYSEEMAKQVQDYFNCSRIRIVLHFKKKIIITVVNAEKC